MSSISSLISQTSSFEPFVSQLVQIESQKKFRLQFEKVEVTNMQGAIGRVSSAISGLENLITEYQEPGNSPFEPLSFSSSNEDIVSIDTVSGLRKPSDFNITVDRLAKTDTQLSQIYTGADTDLSAFGDGELTMTIGEKTETISVQTMKDDGTGTMVAMTNEEILDAFAESIETAFGDEAKATAFNTNDTEVQFSMSSLLTGSANRIQISGATGVLAEVMGGVSRLTPETELDAQFTIDGVTFQRSENTISDAVEGMTFTLNKESAGDSVRLGVDRDLEAAKSNVDDFVQAFNNLNATIRRETFIDDSGNRGPLQRYRSVRNLTLSLRQTAVLSLGGASEGAISRFSDLGIEFNNTGEMRVADSEKLEAALRDRPDEVSAFFSSEDSPVATMKSLAEGFTSSEGILSSLEDGLDQRSDSLDRRIEREEKFLEEYEAEQRRIFNELDLILERGQAQFDQVASFTNGFFNI